MIKIENTKQIEIFEFQHPFEADLDPENRWVKLSKLMPWEKLEEIYSRNFDKKHGRYAKSGRLVIGALILKHKYGYSDVEILEQIKENIYIQYFLGFTSFQKEAAFDPSLMVHIRKRMGYEQFDEMTEEILKIVERNKKKTEVKAKAADKDKEEEPPESGEEKEEISKNQGKLILDATAAEQKIKYPTDLDLLNEARLISENLIDILYKKTDLTKKPRSYRQRAAKEYLSESKKGNKTHREIRKAVGKQIRYLRRNIKSIHKLLDMFEGKEFPLNKREQKQFWVIQLLYSQQEEMYKKKSHRVSDRIVNISQPYVRPIVRGKAKSKVEFGAKIGVSLIDGFARIDNLSWDAYDEGSDMEYQVEKYYQFYGYYPEVVITDLKYLTRANRKYLSEKGIKTNGKPLGRPKEKEMEEEKQRRKKDNAKRSEIEGKFGQGRNGYGLGEIGARRQDTSESWIGAIFFVMNIVRYVKIMDNLFLSLLKNIIRIMKSLFMRTILENIRQIMNHTAITGKFSFA